MPGTFPRLLLTRQVGNRTYFEPHCPRRNLMPRKKYQYQAQFNGMPFFSCRPNRDIF